MEDIDPIYTAKCSSQTIFSADKGFFSEFYECVKESCGEKWIQNYFGKLKDDNLKLKCLFDDVKVCGPVLGTLEHVKPIYKEKNARVSFQRRQEGDKLMQIGDHKKALIFYSQAVIRAPGKGVELLIDNGLSLAMALWCRSAVLLELHDGKHALQDLKYAVEMGLPAKQNAEYYWRMGKCYAMMEDKMKAKVSFGIAEKFLDGRESLLEKLKCDILALDLLPPQKDNTNDKLEPTLTHGENENFKGSSILLDVVTTDKKGRYFVAKNEIKPGDTVIIEEPAAACLLPTFYGSHCLNCFQKLTAPIGCDECSGVAFCSPECKQIACSTFHKFECKFLDLIIGSGMSILCHIALRLMTQSMNPDSAFEKAKNLTRDLCTHSHLRKFDDYLQRTLMASFLLRILQKAEFFGRRITEAVDPTEKEYQIAGILLQLLQGLQFNAHEIYETRLGEKHRFIGAKMTYIGVGIYKSGALLNHNCYPGVARYFLGNKLALTITRPLKSGEMVAENYGPIFTKNNLKERQRILRSRYWFECDCISCKENWPLLNKLTNKARLKCPTHKCENVFRFPDNIEKTLKCVKCKEHISLRKNVESLKKCESIYREAAELMDKERTDDAIKLFQEGIELFHEVAVPPHKDTHIAQDSLRALYSDRGNVSTWN